MAISDVTLPQAREAIARVVSYVQDTRNKMPVEAAARAVQLQMDLGNHQQPTSDYLGNRTPADPNAPFQLPDETQITGLDVVHALQRGWDLSNRGVGWWLTQPRIAYRSPKQFLILDEMVKNLVERGLITTHIPYTTAVAILTETGRALP